MVRAAGLRAGAVAALITSLTGAHGAGDEPVEPGARYLQKEGTTQLWIQVPGKVLSYALPSGPAGARQILLLVAPSDESEAEPAEDDEESDDVRRLPACPEDAEQAATRPLSLYRFDPGGHRQALGRPPGALGDEVA